MAITISALAATAQSANSAEYVVGPVDVVLGKIYLFGFHVKRSDATDPPLVSSVAMGGVPLTQLGHIPYDVGSGTHRGRTYLYAGAATAAGSFSVTAALAATADDLSYVLAEVTGAASTTADAFVQSVTAQATAQTATSTLAAFSDTDNAHFAFFGHGANAAGITPEAGVTELLDVFPASQFHVSGAGWKINDNVITFGVGASAGYGIHSLEIKEGKTAFLGGTITPTGTLAKSVSKTLAGSITPTGTLASLVTRVVLLAGSITPVGTLAKTVSKTLGGSITPTGTLAAQWFTSFLSPLASATLNLIAQVTDALHLTSQDDDTLELDPLDEDPR